MSKVSPRKLAGIEIPQEVSAPADGTHQPLNGAYANLQVLLCDEPSQLRKVTHDP
jgi:hypothetical protein